MNHKKSLLTLALLLSAGHAAAATSDEGYYASAK